MKPVPKWGESFEYACALCAALIQIEFRRRAPSAFCRACTSRIRDHSWLVKHGDSRTPLYRVWMQMRYRCQRRQHPDYPNYGGRGITIDARFSDFVIFRNWAISNGYGPGLLLDRRDNDGPYSPENCRWVTPKVSASNRRSRYRPRSVA